MAYHTRTAALIASVSALAVPVTALGAPAGAAGFYLAEQSNAGLGRGYAGEAMLGGDAAALWYNPALAAEFRERLFTIGGALLVINADYTDRGTSVTRPNLITGQPDTRLAGGVEGDDPVEPTLIPHIAAVLPVGARTTLGLSINAPFGLAVEYPEDWFGRYDSTMSELRTINVQGTLAHQINDRVSIGFGVNVQHVDVTLQNAIANPLTYDTSVPPSDPGFLAPIVVEDGAFSVKGDDVSLGFNVGVLVMPTPGVRVGASYRSAVDHEVTGTFTFDDIAAPDELASVPGLEGLGALSALEVLNGTNDGGADLNLPEIAMVGASVEVTRDVSVFGQLTHFGWSSFEAIRLEAVTGLTLESDFSYSDTLNIAAGLEYRRSDALTLRGGVQWDPSPTADDKRSTRVPDSDRFWVTGGAGITLGNGAKIDAALAYVFYDTTDVTRTDFSFEGTPAQTATTLDATLEGSGLVAGVSLTRAF